MKLTDRVVSDYLELVASDAPAPGGGSASALCASQGVGLIAMVAKLTLSKEKFAEDHPICEKIAAEADELCAKLAAQVDIDTEAYDGLASAFRLPKATDDEKAARKAAIREATKYAAQVPYETMELAVKGLRLAQRLIGHYNTNCASDVGCGVEGLCAGVHGAYLNVLINVSGSAFEEEFLPDAMGLKKEAEVIAKEVSQAVEEAITG